VLANEVGESGFARSACGADGRHDPAPCSVELLVRRARCPQCELLHSVAREAGMRVAVDEPGNGAEPPPVELLDVTVDRPELAHRADRLDHAAGAEDVRVFEHIDLTERRPADRRIRTRGSRELREVAYEQAAFAARRAHSASGGDIGASRPCASAAASASG